MPRLRFVPAAALALLFIAQPGSAQIRVSPTTVNVSSQGATTVFLTFSGLRNYRGNFTAAEAYWCGTVNHYPDGSLRCDLATLYGLLPSRFNQSRLSSTGVFTDLMSIPASVARRAYQAAAAGGSGAFYYVRRFVRTPSDTGVFVAVTLRLSGGGAGVSFALTDVRLAFAAQTPIVFVKAGQRLPPITAEIRYNGGGQLKGRWEVVQPGEELPQSRDLLTEGSLPPMERGTQRRYRELSRFNVFLPPTGRYTLKGPDVSRLPTTIAGGYQLLLRIEVSDNGIFASDSSRAGAVAGFPLPVLRYFVGTGGSELVAASASAVPRQLLPAKNARLKAGRAIDFSWTDAAAFGSYRLEIEREDGSSVLNAVVNGAVGCGLCGDEGGLDDVARYRAPPWLAAKAGNAPLRWRVVVVDHAGGVRSSSEWRGLRPANN